MVQATSGNVLYSWGLIAVCIFIGYAAVQVATKIADEQTAAPASAPPENSLVPRATQLSVYVIDGDTISLNDGRPNVRLVSFNAPETGSRARCETERQKGEAAKRRLRELVSNGRPDFQQVACSCPPGTEGTNACNFGGRYGTLRVNRVDVGSTLVKRGVGGSVHMRRHKLSNAAAAVLLSSRKFRRHGPLPIHTGGHAPRRAQARDMSIWKLSRSFRYRSCGKRHYKPPVRMIKLTEEGDYAQVGASR